MNISNRKYIINYDYYAQSGGSTYEPKPIHNTVFPPKLNSNIWVKKKDGDKVFRGVVKEYIWNKTAAVMKITNLDSGEEYKEVSLKDFNRFENGMNHMLILPTHLWNYQEEHYKFDLKSISEKDDKNLGMVTPQGKVIVDHQGKVMVDKQGAIMVDNNKNQIKNNKNLNSKVNEKFNKFSKNIGFVQKDQKSEDQELTQLELMQNIENSKYFNEDKIDAYLVDKNSDFKSLPEEYIKILRQKLISFEPVDFTEIIVNETVAIDNLITKTEDISNEGKKIARWIERSLKKDAFTDLDITIFNGYIYLSRKGLPTTDKITNELVPELNFFSWQDDKPIDYQTLKYVVFQNEYQKGLITNFNQKLEAEKILSQENIIGLQPKPKYQMWCLKRLLMIWYGDSEIEREIRKIKILVNQFRADGSRDYNKKYGVLPSIVIYPRYGYDSLRKVLSKIQYYFSMYLDDDKDTVEEINWGNSEPTYFLKKNNLIFHTNGAIDLKLYLKESAENLDIKIDSYAEDMSRFKVYKRLQ